MASFLLLVAAMDRAERIEAAIGGIYDAAADIALLPAALTAVADLTGGIGANLIVEDKRRAAPAWFQLGRLDGDLLRVHLRQHHESPSNPWTRAARHLAVGLVSFDDVVPRAELARSAYYADILAPQGIAHHLCIVLRNDAACNLRVGVFRSATAGPGDAAEAGILARLAPHFGRAVLLAGRVETLALAQRGVLDAVGGTRQAVLILDAEGRVMLASPPAEAILRGGDGLDARDGRPAAWAMRQEARLQRLIDAAIDGRAGGTVTVARQSGRVPYIVNLMPLRRPAAWPLARSPAAVMLINDLDRATGDAAAVLVRLYDLTPMQARVAVEVARGAGLADTARRLRVALNTVRAHLQRVLRKTGARNQVALAALVSRAAELPDLTHWLV